MLAYALEQDDGSPSIPVIDVLEDIVEQFPMRSFRGF